MRAEDEAAVAAMSREELARSGGHNRHQQHSLDTRVEEIPRKLSRPRRSRTAAPLSVLISTQEASHLEVLGYTRELQTTQAQVIQNFRVLRHKRGRGAEPGRRPRPRKSRGMYARPVKLPSRPSTRVEDVEDRRGDPQQPGTWA